MFSHKNFCKSSCAKTLFLDAAAGTAAVAAAAAAGAASSFTTVFAVVASQAAAKAAAYARALRAPHVGSHALVSVSIFIFVLIYSTSAEFAQHPP